MRLANVYGPGDKSDRFIPTFIRNCIAKKLPLEVLGGKGVVRDFIYIDDVITGLMSSIDMAGDVKIINIGTGKETTIGEVAEIIKNNLGLEAEEIHYQVSQGSQVLHNVLDVAEARKLVNYKSSVSLKEGILKTIKWWQNN